MLIDGVKVNDPSGIGDAYDFGHLLTGNIDRIEVLRGIEFGRARQPGDRRRRQPDDRRPGRRLRAPMPSAEYGYSDTLTAKADVSGTAEPISGGIGGAYFRTDGISSAAVGTEKDGYKNFAGNARLKVAFGDALSLDLRGYYINADLDYDSFFGTPADSGDVAKLDQYVGYAEGLNLGLFDGHFTSRAAVTWLRNDRDYYFVRGTAARSTAIAGTNLRFEYQGVVTPVRAGRS